MTIGTLTVAVILELAFKKVIEAGVGEATKQGVDKAGKLIGELYQKIRDRLSHKPEAEAKIQAIEQGQTDDLATVVPYLQAEMADDPKFAEEVRQLAQQIINIDDVEGKNVQINSGDGYFNPDNKGQIFQGVENSTFHINYGPPSTD